MINVNYQNTTKSVMPLISFNDLYNEIKSAFCINNDNFKLAYKDNNQIIYLDEDNYNQFTELNIKDISIITDNTNISQIDNYISKEEISNIIKQTIGNPADIINECVSSISTYNKNENEIISNIYHPDIKCNVCNKVGIHGIRYKCPICNEYNLCQQCEIQYSKSHEHPLLKLEYQI